MMQVSSSTNIISVKSSPDPPIPDYQQKDYLTVINFLRGYEFERISNKRRIPIVQKRAEANEILARTRRVTAKIMLQVLRTRNKFELTCENFVKEKEDKTGEDSDSDSDTDGDRDMDENQIGMEASKKYGTEKNILDDKRSMKRKIQSIDNAFSLAKELLEDTENNKLYQSLYKRIPSSQQTGEQVIKREGKTIVSEFYDPRFYPAKQYLFWWGDAWYPADEVTEKATSELDILTNYLYNFTHKQVHNVPHQDKQAPFDMLKYIHYNYNPDKVLQNQGVHHPIKSDSLINENDINEEQTKNEVQEKEIIRKRKKTLRFHGYSRHFDLCVEDTDKRLREQLVLLQHEKRLIQGYFPKAKEYVRILLVDEFESDYFLHPYKYNPIFKTYLQGIKKLQNQQDAVFKRGNQCKTKEEDTTKSDTNIYEKENKIHLYEDPYWYMKTNLERDNYNRTKSRLNFVPESEEGEEDLQRDKNTPQTDNKVYNLDNMNGHISYFKEILKKYWCPVGQVERAVPMKDFSEVRVTVLTCDETIKVPNVYIEPISEEEYKASVELIKDHRRYVLSELENIMAKIQPRRLILKKYLVFRYERCQASFWDESYRGIRMNLYNPHNKKKYTFLLDKNMAVTLQLLSARRIEQIQDEENNANLNNFPDISLDEKETICCKLPTYLALKWGELTVDPQILLLFKNSSRSSKIPLHDETNIKMRSNNIIKHLNTPPNETRDLNSSNTFHEIGIIHGTLKNVKISLQFLSNSISECDHILAYNNVPKKLSDNQEEEEPLYKKLEKYQEFFTKQEIRGEKQTFEHQQLDKERSSDVEKVRLVIRYDGDISKEIIDIDTFHPDANLDSFINTDGHIISDNSTEYNNKIESSGKRKLKLFQATRKIELMFPTNIWKRERRISCDTGADLSIFPNHLHWLDRDDLRRLVWALSTRLTTLFGSPVLVFGGKHVIVPKYCFDPAPVDLHDLLHPPLPQKGKNTLALEAMVKAKNEEIFKSVQHTYVELEAIELREKAVQATKEKHRLYLMWDPTEHILTVPSCLYNLSDFILKQIPLYINPQGKDPALLKPKKNYVSLLGPPSIEEQKKAAIKMKQEFEAKVNAARQNNKRKNRMYYYQTVQRIPTLPALDNEHYVRVIQECHESIKNNAKDIESFEIKMVDINRQHTLTALKVFEAEKKIEYLKNLREEQIIPRYERVEWQLFECRLQKIELEDNILSGIKYISNLEIEKESIQVKEKVRNEDFMEKQNLLREEYPDFNFNFEFSLKEDDITFDMDNDDSTLDALGTLSSSSSIISTASMSSIEKGKGENDSISSTASKNSQNSRNKYPLILNKNSQGSSNNSMSSNKTAHPSSTTGENIASTVSSFFSISAISTFISRLSSPKSSSKSSTSSPKSSFLQRNNNRPMKGKNKYEVKELTDIESEKVQGTESPQLRKNKSNKRGGLLLTNSQKLEKLKKEAEEEQNILIENHKARSLSHLRRIRYLEHQINKIQERVNEIKMEIGNLEGSFSISSGDSESISTSSQSHPTSYDEDNKSFSSDISKQLQTNEERVQETLKREERKMKRDLEYSKVKSPSTLYCLEREYKVVFFLLEVVMVTELKKACNLLEEQRSKCQDLIENRVKCRKSLHIATKNILNMRNKVKWEESIFKKKQIEYMKSVTCFDYDWKEIKNKKVTSMLPKNSTVNDGREKQSFPNKLESEEVKSISDAISTEDIQDKSERKKGKDKETLAMHYKTAYDIQLPHENISFKRCFVSVRFTTSEKDPIPDSVDLLSLSMGSNISHSIEESHKRLDVNSTGVLFTVSPYKINGDLWKNKLSNVTHTNKSRPEKLTLFVSSTDLNACGYPPFCWMNDTQQNFVVQLLMERLIFIGNELLVDLKPVLAYKKLDLSSNLWKEVYELEHQKSKDEASSNGEENSERQAGAKDYKLGIQFTNEQLSAKTKTLGGKKKHLEKNHKLTTKFNGMHLNLPQSWCPKHIYKSTIDLLQHEVLSIQDAGDHFILSYPKEVTLCSLQGRKMNDTNEDHQFLDSDYHRQEDTLYISNKESYLLTVEKLKEEMGYEDAVLKEVKDRMTSSIELHKERIRIEKENERRKEKIKIGSKTTEEVEEDIKSMTDNIIKDLAVKRDIFGILNKNFDGDFNSSIVEHEVPIQRIKIYASDVRRMGLFDLPIPNANTVSEGISLGKIRDKDTRCETYMSIRWMPVNMRRHIALRILILATVDINTKSIEREKKAMSYKQLAPKASYSFKTGEIAKEVNNLDHYDSDSISFSDNDSDASISECSSLRNSEIEKFIGDNDSGESFYKNLDFNSLDDDCSCGSRSYCTICATEEELERERQEQELLDTSTFNTESTLQSGINTEKVDLANSNLNSLSSCHDSTETDVSREMPFISNYDQATIVNGNNSYSLTSYEDGRRRSRISSALSLKKGYILKHSIVRDVILSFPSEEETKSILIWKGMQPKLGLGFVPLLVTVYDEGGHLRFVFKNYKGIELSQVSITLNEVQKIASTIWNYSLSSLNVKKASVLDGTLLSSKKESTVDDSSFMCGALHPKSVSKYGEAGLLDHIQSTKRWADNFDYPSISRSGRLFIFRDYTLWPLNMTNAFKSRLFSLMIKHLPTYTNNESTTGPKLTVETNVSTPPRPQISHFEHFYDNRVKQMQADKGKSVIPLPQPKILADEDDVIRYLRNRHVNPNDLKAGEKALLEKILLGIDATMSFSNHYKDFLHMLDETEDNEDENSVDTDHNSMNESKKSKKAKKTKARDYEEKKVEPKESKHSLRRQRSLFARDATKERETCACCAQNIRNRIWEEEDELEHLAREKKRIQQLCIGSDLNQPNSKVATNTIDDRSHTDSSTITETSTAFQPNNNSLTLSDQEIESTAKYEENEKKDISENSFEKPQYSTNYTSSSISSETITAGEKISNLQRSADLSEKKNKLETIEVEEEVGVQKRIRPHRRFRLGIKPESHTHGRLDCTHEYNLCDLCAKNVKSSQQAKKGRGKTIQLQQMLLSLAPPVEEQPDNYARNVRQITKALNSWEIAGKTKNLGFVKFIDHEEDDNVGNVEPFRSEEETKNDRNEGDPQVNMYSTNDKATVLITNDNVAAKEDDYEVYRSLPTPLPIRKHKKFAIRKLQKEIVQKEAILKKIFSLKSSDFVSMEDFKEMVQSKETDFKSIELSSSSMEKKTSLLRRRLINHIEDSMRVMLSLGEPGREEKAELENFVDFRKQRKIKWSPSVLSPSVNSKGNELASENGDKSILASIKEEDNEVFISLQRRAKELATEEEDTEYVCNLCQKEIDVSLDPLFSCTCCDEYDLCLNCYSNLPALIPFQPPRIVTGDEIPETEEVHKQNSTITNDSIDTTDDCIFPNCKVCLRNRKKTLNKKKKAHGHYHALDHPMTVRYLRREIVISYDETEAMMEHTDAELKRQELIHDFTIEFVKILLTTLVDRLSSSIYYILSEKAIDRIIDSTITKISQSSPFFQTAKKEVQELLNTALIDIAKKMKKKILQRQAATKYINELVEKVLNDLSIPVQYKVARKVISEILYRAVNEMSVKLLKKENNMCSDKKNENNEVILLPDITNVDIKAKNELLSKLEEELTPTSFINNLMQEVILSISRQKEFVGKYNSDEMAKEKVQFYIQDIVLTYLESAYVKVVKEKTHLETAELKPLSLRLQFDAQRQLVEEDGEQGSSVLQSQSMSQDIKAQIEQDAIFSKKQMESIHDEITVRKAQEIASKLVSTYFAESISKCKVKLSEIN